MGNALVHIPSGTLFYSSTKSAQTAKSAAKYRTATGAVFPVSECKEWAETLPPLATKMPPEIGEVVGLGNHCFVVLSRARERGTDRVKLWHTWDAETKKGDFYWQEDCHLILDGLINSHALVILACREAWKESSKEYQKIVNEIPIAIRDRCILKSFELKKKDLPPNPDSDPDGFW